ncbi:MAG TPA: biopolymer transporter ExbD [Gemmatimonadaceae bacterium]|nr:biopolymer transporter ExbD [Gemmatimonadaceae bacterium]
MASRFHKSRQRRAEREPLTAHGSLNLVPLVDILTSIVFFSLLTYTGAAMAMLTSFDLQLPPVVVTGQSPTASTPEKTLNLLLAVRVLPGGVRVEHSGGDGGFSQDIEGTGPEAIEQLQTVLTQVHSEYPDNGDILVVPNDEVQYDRLIKVMEAARLARFDSISLGSQARGTQQTATGAIVPTPGGR